MFSAPNAVFCLGCLQDGVASVKIDKKGRPYSYCGVCGTRTFYHSIAGLSGLAFLAPHVARLVAGVPREQIQAAAQEQMHRLEKEVA